MTGRWFSPGNPGSFNQTDRHDKTEILLKVALNTINQPNQAWILFQNLVDCMLSTLMIAFFLVVDNCVTLLNLQFVHLSICQSVWIERTKKQMNGNNELTKLNTLLDHKFTGYSNKLRAWQRWGSNPTQLSHFISGDQNICVHRLIKAISLTDLSVLTLPQTSVKL